MSDVADQPPPTSAGPDADRWTGDVVLADGGTVFVRPIHPDDAAEIVEFHGRQSRESIYYRFFSPRPHLSDAEVERLTTVDGVDRMAFVALLDDDIIGVARYDRYDDRPEAEAAFFTDDAHGGRGIATMLLEYLAAHAREVGVSKFFAQTLPDNRRMVSVFQRAGFRTTSQFTDGVIEVELDLEPTPEAAEAMARRARIGDLRAVSRLLAPSSIAVIGAGRDPESLGHRVLRNLLDQPFSGPVYPVHPEAASVAGVRAYPSVLEVPDDIALAVVCVPAAEVKGVIEQCARVHVGTAVIITAGFAEAGPDGRALQDDIVATARRSGLRIVGPNCLGVINTDPEVGLRATFTAADPIPGHTGLLSQSGTLGSVILDEAARVGVGISSFVAAGNKSDLSGNDVLQYWGEDERTHVVLLYLESFGNPRRFSRNVRRVARRKPVFAVRAGAAQASSGDGWLDDDTVDALLRQTGVVRVASLDALLAAARVAAQQPRPSGDGVVVVGNSGGSSSMAADACVAADLTLVELRADAIDDIDDLRLHGRSTDNPVDLPYDASPWDYERTLDAVLADPAVDAALAIYAPYRHLDAPAFGEALDRIAARHPTKTIVGCVYAPHDPVSPGGVPLFDFPDAAAHAIGDVARYGRWLEGEGSASPKPGAEPETTRTIVADALEHHGAAWLSPDGARALVTAAGVPAVETIAVPDADAARALEDPEWPVAVKANARRPGARRESDGVALDVRDRADFDAAVSSIVAAMGDDTWPLLVQPMVSSGTDIRVALGTHPVVGPVLRIGPGGLAGRFSDGRLQVLPISEPVAEDLVDDAGLAEILTGADKQAVVHLIGVVASLAETAPEITDIICDPVIVADGTVHLVDVAVHVAPLRGQTPQVRRL